MEFKPVPLDLEGVMSLLVNRMSFAQLVPFCRWLCAALFLGAGARLAFAASAGDVPRADSSCHLERLRCEYLVNPLGIDVLQPRLDWVLVGSSQTPRGTMQAAYQILVASSESALAQNQGDLWDTGKVASDQTAHIAYAGKPLISREACYWKVRVWDSQGKSSAWSETASWEMGLLKPDDWQAKWIERPPAATQPAAAEARQEAASKAPTSSSAHRAAAHPAKPEYEPIPLLRTELTVASAPIIKARLYVTALGLYEMHLNGQRVGDHILAPDWTDYSKRVRYQVYDVTSMVKPGTNALGAFLANGWYSGRIGNGGFQAWGSVPALFAQLEIIYGDGKTQRVVTDSSWKTHPSPITSSDFMKGEDYDATLEIAGWDQPGLNASDWQAAVERPDPQIQLNGQVDQPVRQTGMRHPQSVSQPVPGHFVYDMGQNMVGVVRLKVSALAGTKVTIRHAEMLNPDGTLYTKNLRGATSIDSYICKGAGLETWQPRFTFHGFRYVELTGLPTPPTTDTITGIVIGTDIPRTGEFSCSDTAVNQLQSNIQWGMRGNYLSVPTDCPQRDERMGWMGDAEVFIRTAAYNGDIAAFFTKWLVDVDDAQTPAGAFVGVSPSPVGRGHGSPGVPAWGDAGVICPWTIYLMYGDKRILQEHLPAMTRWIDWLQTHSDDLIRDRDRGDDYGDWLSQGEKTPKDVIGTAFFAYSTSLVARSYRAIGDTTNADKYQHLFEQIRKAFNKAYVSADGHIKGNTQCDYCMALRFDLLPDDLRATAAGYLEDDVKAHQDHLTTGFIGVSYLLPALCSENKIDTAYGLFLQDTFPSWLFSVKQGATTIWERWDGWTPQKGFENPSMNSFNHYSLGSCGQWMFDTVAGIGVDLAQPGFAHIIIRPRPGGGLTQAEGSLNSIHGKIATKWTLHNGQFSLVVWIPINTTATLYLPTSDGASIEEGGVKIAEHPEIKPAAGGAGGASFEIGSGDYDFTCEMH
jgi:alpha-L-rhamnosidase